MKLRLRPLLLFVAALMLAGTPSAFAKKQPSAADLAPISNPVPALPDGVYDSSQVTAGPVSVYIGRPDYPVAMSKSNTPGVVQVLFTVWDDGSVRNVVVVSATNRYFAEAAVEAVKHWRFHPAQVNKQAVKCRMQVPVNFTVGED